MRTSNSCDTTRGLMSDQWALKPATPERAERRRIMPSYSPELIHSMRVALNEVMMKIPVERATPEVKAYLAEIILKSAAKGQTDYEVLLAAASEKIQTALSQLIPPASVRPTRR